MSPEERPLWPTAAMAQADQLEDSGDLVGLLQLQLDLLALEGLVYQKVKRLTAHRTGETPGS